MARIDKDAFAHMMMRAIASAGDTRAYVYDAASFVLRVRDLDDATHSNAFFLGNAHREYEAANDDAARHGILQRWVTMTQARDTQDSFAEALVSLMPRVRDRAYYGIIPLQLRAQRVSDRVEKLAHTPLGDVLAVSLTRDMPETIEEVSPEQLVRWNVGYERAYEVAMANLARRSAGAFEEIAPGLYVSPWHDNYDASRLLLPDCIRAIPVRGTPIAIAATRDCLLVTGDEDVPGLLAMAQVAERALEDPRPLSGCAIRLSNDNTWAPTLPPRGHPAHAPFWKLATSFWFEAYHEQKQLLEVLNEEDGIDVFVASYEAVVEDEGGYSYAVWSNGVDTLLPDSNVIMMLTSEEAEPLRVDTLLARTRLSHLFEIQPDVYPPRWRVRTFPSPAELRALFDSR